MVKGKFLTKQLLGGSIMAVFEISSTYEPKGIHRSLSYKGIFTLNEKTQEIRGYLEALTPFVCPPIRYIYGIYDQRNNLLSYLQLSNDPCINPLLFIFFDTRASGIWSAYDSDIGRFFPFHIANGYAQITLQEIVNPTEIEDLSKISFRVFNECSDLLSNIMLIYKGVRPYIEDMSY